MFLHPFYILWIHGFPTEPPLQFFIQCPYDHPALVRAVVHIVLRHFAAGASYGSHQAAAVGVVVITGKHGRFPLVHVLYGHLDLGHPFFEPFGKVGALSPFPVGIATPPCVNRCHVIHVLPVFPFQ